MREFANRGTVHTAHRFDGHDSGGRDCIAAIKAVAIALVIFVRFLYRPGQHTRQSCISLSFLKNRRNIAFVTVH